MQVDIKDTFFFYQSYATLYIYYNILVFNNYKRKVTKNDT